MVLRSLLLYLSRQRQVRRWMETSPAADRLTRRFIAGQTLEKGLDICRRLNGEGILVTLDHLGENVTSIEEASGSLDAGLEALHRVAEQRLDATVSVKLTQFGLDLSEEVCRANLDRLVAVAGERGGVVEVDMESHEYVDRTLKLVSEMHRRHRRVRGVIQAYLRRSAEDVERLCAEKIPIRLCKGAYKEPRTVAFPNKGDVNANYLHLARILFEKGAYPALATHNPKLIAGVLRYAQERNVPPEQFEFQMLYGIRRDLQRRLVADGYRLRLYVPYGNAWYPYFMRRLAERPANIIFLARNVLRK